MYNKLFAKVYFYLVYNVRFTLLILCKIINVLRVFINETFDVTLLILYFENFIVGLDVSNVVNNGINFCINKILFTI